MSDDDVGSTNPFELRWVKEQPATSWATYDGKGGRSEAVPGYFVDQNTGERVEDDVLFKEANEYMGALPARWSLGVAVDSIDWLCVTWYRWYFSHEEGLPVAYCWEWSLRHFWKVDITP